MADQYRVQVLGENGEWVTAQDTPDGGIPMPQHGAEQGQSAYGAQTLLPFGAQQPVGLTEEEAPIVVKRPFEKGNYVSVTGQVLEIQHNTNELPVIKLQLPSGVMWFREDKLDHLGHTNVENLTPKGDQKLSTTELNSASDVKQETADKDGNSDYPATKAEQESYSQTGKEDDPFVPNESKQGEQVPNTASADAYPNTGRAPHGAEESMEGPNPNPDLQTINAPVRSDNLLSEGKTTANPESQPAGEPVHSDNLLSDGQPVTNPRSQGVHPETTPQYAATTPYSDAPEANQTDAIHQEAAHIEAAHTEESHMETGYPSL